MRILALFLLLTYAATADSPFHDVLSLEIPEGGVARIEVAGEVIWPSIPYATNGLIAYWDGVWNAGIGIHDPETTVWRDLSKNGFDATQQVASGWSWSGDAYAGTSNNGHKFKPHYEFSRQFAAAYSNHTVEIVSSAAAMQRMTIFGGYSSYPVNFEYYLSGGGISFRAYYNNSPNKLVPTRMSRASYAVRSASDGISLYIDGVFAGTASANTYRLPSTTSSIFIGGELDRANMSMVGEICVIRVYNRALSPAEIAHNAAIDSLRFGIIQQLLTDQ